MTCTLSGVGTGSTSERFFSSTVFPCRQRKAPSSNGNPRGAHPAPTCAAEYRNCGNRWAFRVATGIGSCRGLRRFSWLRRVHSGGKPVGKPCPTVRTFRFVSRAPGAFPAIAEHPASGLWPMRYSRNRGRRARRQRRPGHAPAGPPSRQRTGANARSKNARRRDDSPLTGRHLSSKVSAP